MFSFAGLLQLRVAGSSELLTVTCPSLSEAENIADLIDGYCRLVNNSPTSIWMRRGKIRTPLKIKKISEANFIVLVSSKNKRKYLPNENKVCNLLLRFSHL